MTRREFTTNCDFVNFHLSDQLSRFDFLYIIHNETFESINKKLYDNDIKYHDLIKLHHSGKSDPAIFIVTITFTLEEEKYYGDDDSRGE